MKFNYLFTIIKRGIFKDFILNIASTVLLTAATQLIVYPYLSRIMTIEEYGLVLTIMGIVNAVGVSLGNPLNNTRILLQPQYEKENYNGDYNPIFLCCLLLNVIVVLFLTGIIYKELNFTVIGCVLVSTFILFRAYYSASYRIIINYKKNLISSLFGFIGYLVGISLTYYTDKWVLTFIFGELFSCIYIYFTAKIVHDSFKITPLFKKSLNKYTFLMLAGIFATLMTYMDRFFIYPILGVEQVSIYNVASFLGKTAGIVMTPITGVLLTYYAKEERLTVKQFLKRTGIFAILSLLIYFFMILIDTPITTILYPTLSGVASKYFVIANLAAVSFIFGNTIQPTLLRYCDTRWQLVIQIFYFVIYLGLGYFGMNKHGLLGFCYSVLIVNIFKISLMMLITIVSLHKREKKGVNYVEN